jgi:preprotein translocase subunit YajC
MTTIHADELRPGDDIVDDGGFHHRVTHIECRSGWAFPIAFSDDGWAIAVGHQLLNVDRAA